MKDTIFSETQKSAADLRVLYLTKTYPYAPAAAGDAVYSRGIIESLSEACKLEVLCAGSGVDVQPASNIIWHCVRPQRTGRAGSVLSRWPLIAWKGATASYQAALRDLLKQDWDVIVLDNLGLAHALPRAQAYRTARPQTRLVYVSHEYEYPTRSGKYGRYKMGWLKRLLAMLDLKKVKRSEIALLRHCDIVTVINTADIEPFKLIAPERKYLPLTPGYTGPVVQHRQINPSTPRRVLLLGGRKSEQKRQILLDWLDICHEPFRQSKIETVVAGDMDESLKRYIDTTYDDVKVLGFVNNLAELIESARLGLVVDTVGGGFKLRLLSHVFERLPIVGLSSAISGLPTKEGEGFLGAETLEDLIELVLEVIDDAERLNALQNKAFADCASEYSWTGRANDFLMACQNKHREMLR